MFPFRRAPKSTDDNPGMDTHLGMWVTGTGTKVYGSKFVLASARTLDYKSRIVTDFRHVQHHVEDESGEAKAVLAVLREVLPEAPGIRAITCDSALRGNDVSAVHALGPVVINDPHVKAKANKDNGTPAVYKSHLAATINGRACTHQIVYQHGAPHERTIDGDGNPILAPLVIAEYKRYRNKNGTYRHYHVLTVTCPDGDHEVRIPLFHNDGPDAGLKFNRGEYIRVIPPGSAEHKAWYGFRNDTEALHSELKERKIRLPRGSVVGQELRLLGYFVGQNAVANAIWQRAQGQPNALDNTA